MSQQFEFDLFIYIIFFLRFVYLNIHVANQLADPMDRRADVLECKYLGIKLKPILFLEELILICNISELLIKIFPGVSPYKGEVDD